MLEGKKVCNPGSPSGILISGEKRGTKESIEKKKIKSLHFFLQPAACEKEGGQRWPRSQGTARTLGWPGAANPEVVSPWIPTLNPVILVTCWFL